jgi:hypothetical protein
MLHYSWKVEDSNPNWFITSATPCLIYNLILWFFSMEFVEDQNWLSPSLMCAQATSNGTEVTHALGHEAGLEAYKYYEVVSELISGRNTQCHMAACDPISVGKQVLKWHAAMPDHTSRGKRVLRWHVWASKSALSRGGSRRMLCHVSTSKPDLSEDRSLSDTC